MVPVKNNNEIVLYQPDNTISIDVLMKNEMVWINRQQMASLFGRDVKTIGKHINNALDEELKGVPTVAKFATLQKEGNRLVNRDIEYYRGLLFLLFSRRPSELREVRQPKFKVNNTAKI